MSRIQNTKQRRLARKRLWEKQEGRCVWCKRPMVFECAQPGQSHNPREATIEHLKRKADGGTNRLENLSLACRECNLMRDACLRMARLEGDQEVGVGYHSLPEALAGLKIP